MKTLFDNQYFLILFYYFSTTDKDIWHVLEYLNSAALAGNQSIGACPSST